MNLTISLGQFNEWAQLNHPILTTLSNEVYARITIVDSIKEVTIPSVLPNVMPIRKDGVYGAYDGGNFIVDTTIAALVPNGPAAKVIIFNDGRPSKDVSNAEPHNIKYQFSIGATMDVNPQAKKFDWDIQISKEVASKVNVGFTFKTMTVEGHWFSLTIAKDKEGKINPMKYTKY